MDLGNPLVEMARQANEAFRVRWNGLDDRLIQTYPDRELNEHRAQTAKRVNTLFAVELHRLLGRALPIAFVLVLDLLHHRLESAHGLDLATLFHCERDHRDSYQQREGNYRDAKVGEQVVVEQHQPVDHRLDDHEVPGV